ncbi:class I SAM-dependent methyltransferase [Longimicrobium terrae]|uniref:tRNA (Cmo5U34)-methyltransferase n=1 Tax=Longimicrobium terrae TaxID=1639882 RepID=A0A841GZF5_9BACT|nr:class I SAM-dependent methyltransferase [Longimicrobium terrae]MBB4636863.1 tRNA (cmo5U34)-methyltransferase [Longimicrobium terrae]MBB6071137.1 tRNA (cmo5U34)-methyltransferase [Longimicrobium terrae]NNC29186.1 methyltransferase domain-containing protein [Longimicrobium terrae]
MSDFSDPRIVAGYAERPVRQVPGFHGLQRMAGLLIAERVPDDAHVLVLGAGGGLELKAFAEMQPGWRFCGVDPSAEMLALAGRTLGPLAPRASLHHGYIDSAPAGPFDAATCILTLHFLPEEERRRTLAQVHERLRPGAPFVVAHHSVPQRDEAEKAKWLARYAAFAIASGVPISDAKSAIADISKRLPLLSPEQDEAMLREAGFNGVELFYAGFTFRGWVGYKG